VNQEVRTQAAGQQSGQAWVFFENNYTLSHKTPESPTVVNGGLQRLTRLRGGWENHDSTD
jgi:uncharacterized protein YaiE (UPF0345 family)